LETLDFIGAPDSSRTQINDWVADNTNDRIKDLLPAGSVTSDTRLVLANAVYFNGKWKYEFEESATHEAPFYLADGAMAATPTMFQLSPFKYGQFGGFQMLEMPYAGDDLSMVILLPNERDGLAVLEAALTAELFDASVAGLLQQQVEVRLPKFTFRDKASLRAPLEALGMTDAFNNADFTGIADGGLAISGVLHQTFIDVNESGTEAAGATGVIIGVTSVPPPPPVFRADHPFLCALRDAHTGSVLFLGRMADPGGATASAGVPEPAAAALALGSLAALGLLRGRSRR
jgi:serpin B